jgi:hypothetical protein
VSADDEPRELWRAVAVDSDATGTRLDVRDDLKTPFEAEIVAGMLRAELLRLDELASRKPRFVPFVGSSE